ncbi:MAG: hypothetical protein WC069_05935 [Candidatus Shapirobacteria bacterium]
MNKNTNAIKGYFTQDIRDAIRDMDDKDMISYLKELEGTKFWFAILKYNQQRISTIQDSFLVLDPVKEPSKISQYQGVITGMLDLQDAVLSLKFESKKSENPKYKEEKEQENNGGAYGVV